jgi:hypothetical protein
MTAEFDATEVKNELKLSRIVTRQPSSNRLEWRYGQYQAPSIGPAGRPPPATDGDQPGGYRGVAVEF